MVLALNSAIAASGVARNHRNAVSGPYCESGNADARRTRPTRKTGISPFEAVSIWNECLNDDVSVLAGPEELDTSWGEHVESEVGGVADGEGCAHADNAGEGERNEPVAAGE